MSGKPWPEGVTEAMRLISLITVYEEEVGPLRAAAARLEVVNEEWRKANNELQKLLKSMDVDSTQKGNWGWEARFSWFLREMLRQAVKHG